MDIDCCRNVRVSNCSVNSPWDDAICPKSSFALGFARATEFLTIGNCLVTGATKKERCSMARSPLKRFAPAAKGARTGRIKFGTESNGGFKNITIANCVFDTCHGLALESVDGAQLEDIAINNITMRDIYEAPIFMRLGSRMRGPAGRPNRDDSPRPDQQRCLLRRGLYYLLHHYGHPGTYDRRRTPEQYRSLSTRAEGHAMQASFRVPEKEAEYPDPDMFGPMPAHGFFVRHVQGIEMEGIKIIAGNRDERPAFVLEDVENADFTRPQAPVTAGVPLFVLSDVENFRLRGSAHLPDTSLDRVAHKEILPE